MKVFLVGPSLEQRGGVASVLRGLSSFLTSQGIEGHVISTTAQGHIFFGGLAFIRAFINLLGVCLIRRPDIVHIHMASRGSCFRKSILGLTCWLFRIPFIIHLHGAEFHAFHDEELGPKRRLLVEFIFVRAARVIALSDTWKTWLKAAMGLDNVVVVFNGVQDLPATTGTDGTPTVLFLGRLGARKGTDELIKAMRAVTQKVPNVVLELGGDGDLEIYRQQAADLANVRFLGWVDDAGRKAALARATVYCLPSWNEGLPMSVLEAMSAGLPVVSTPVGGIPEAVVEGVTGLLVQPGNEQSLAAALIKLLLDPDLARTMGRNGQSRHREHFSTEAMGKGCLEVYATCLKQ
jgi:polysaccharide biosynthesis protein VpsI